MRAVPIAGRWFLSAALAAILVAGARGPAWAQPAKPENPPKPAPPEPTLTLPNKKIAFAMDGKPWAEVFKWLSDETGLPVVYNSRPSGSFSFIGPQKKTYTLAE